jgi:hypothetical protein
MVKTLNPAMLLPVRPGGPDHDCTEIMNEVFSSCPASEYQQLDHPDVDYFTDGNSFVHQDKGYQAMTDPFPVPYNWQQGSRQASTQTLNMPLLPCMSMELCIKKKDS